MRSEARRDRNAVIALPSSRCSSSFAWSGYLVQYLVLWVLPLVTVVQAILRLRAIAEHGATTDFSSPLTAARTNLGAGVAALADLPAPRQLPHRAPSLRLGAALQPAAAARGDDSAQGVLEGAEVVPFRATLGKIFAERPSGA